MNNTIRALIVMVTVGLRWPELANAGEPESPATDRAMVTQFLKNHVMGKTVAKFRESRNLDNNRMESVQDEQLTFNNFTETAQGFNFDETTVSKETRYDLDANGKRILPGRDLSGTSVSRYEIRERVSTKKLTGTIRTLSKTVDIPSREGVAILITAARVVDGKLIMNDSVAGYLDLVAPKGKYVPGSWDSKGTFSVVDGRLQAEWQVTVFDVDPDTLKRTPRRDFLPPSIFKELEPKPSR